ncbi:MAG TPA: hypothetical protein VNN77_14090 [candidate division Zixibacteria bacterium]|nr:hypothetical protein [candidate division Zixibacteria bacterium]
MAAGEALALERWPLSSRLILLGLNVLPFAHLALVAASAAFAAEALIWRAAAAVATLYLVPPGLARAVRRLSKIPEGRIPVPSTAFFAWWALLQLQMVFCRAGFLEEALRLIPGAYSAWLRLWGARIGRLAFWAPGVSVLDRPFVSVGDDVVFGARVQINPHVFTRDRSGRTELLLGTVRIGDRATVGGYSLLTAGSAIAAGESPPALLVLPPFSIWKDGRRVKSGTAGGVRPRPAPCSEDPS